MFCERFIKIKEAQKNAQEKDKEQRGGDFGMSTQNKLCAIDGCKNKRKPLRDTCFRCNKCGRFSKK